MARTQLKKLASQTLAEYDLLVTQYSEDEAQQMLSVIDDRCMQENIVLADLYLQIESTETRAGIIARIGEKLDSLGDKGAEAWQNASIEIGDEVKQAARGLLRVKQLLEQLVNH